jgi:hypothetical protein
MRLFVLRKKGFTFLAHPLFCDDAFAQDCSGQRGAASAGDLGVLVRIREI